MAERPNINILLRNISVETMLKKMGSVFIIFGLHPKLGYYGIWAPVKAGWRANKYAPLYFICKFVESITEGEKLVNCALAIMPKNITRSLLHFTFHALYAIVLSNKNFISTFTNA